MASDGEDRTDRDRQPRRLALATITADQALNSASNFVVAVIAGTTLDRRGFGGFATQLLALTAVVNLVRSVVHEPRLADAASRWFRPPLWSLVLCCGPLGLLTWFRPHTQLPLALCAVTLVVLAQDQLRYHAMHQRRGVALLLADGAWLVAAVGVLVSGTSAATPDDVLLWWGGTAAVSVPFLLIGRAVATTTSDGARRSVVPRRILVVEHLLNHGPVQLAMFVSAGLLRPEVFAVVRSAVTVLGPIGVLTLALSTWCFANHADHADPPTNNGSGPARTALTRSALVAGAGMVLVVGLLLVPPQLGTLVLGPSWPDRALLAGFGATVVAQSVSSTVLTLLKISGASKALLTLRLTAAGGLVGTVTAAALAGSPTAVGAAFAATNLTLALMALLSLRAVAGQRAPSSSLPAVRSQPRSTTVRAAVPASSPR